MKKIWVIGGTAAALALAYTFYSKGASAKELEDLSYDLLPCSGALGQVAQTVVYLPADRQAQALERIKALEKALQQTDAGGDLIELWEGLAEFKSSMNADGVPMELGAKIPGLPMRGALDPTWFAMHSFELEEASKSSRILKEAFYRLKYDAIGSSIVFQSTGSSWMLKGVGNDRSCLESYKALAAAAPHPELLAAIGEIEKASVGENDTPEKVLAQLQEILKHRKPC